jgi:hypothetical protein
VNYTIVVPEPMQDEICSWGMSLEAEDDLYAQLEPGLTQQRLDQCRRLAGPVPIFILDIEFQDPRILGILHFCTFHLVYGEQDGLLSMLSAFHTETEDWGVDDKYSEDA